jgi:ferredoxin
VNCGLCVKNCKASCIDPENAAIDASRCVACFNCLDICRQKAIVYTLSSRVKTSRVPERPNLARRSVLGAALGFAALPFTAGAATRETEVEALTRQSRVPREVPVVPPGAWGLHRYKERCTSCQVCVSSCPNNVLSSHDRGAGMLQPSLSFERGYCRVNCVECSKICPTSAIRPITVAEKSSIQIGRALLDNKRCIVNTKNVDCTVCTRNCPNGSIGTIRTPDGAKWVVVNFETCTGCGACEYFCPVRPQAAVRVEGNLEHRRI